jgi:hypothetical protein
MLKLVPVEAPIGVTLIKADKADVTSTPAVFFTSYE